MVITHEASIGGAPILLLRLMVLLKEEGFVFNTLVMTDGPLYKEFESISDKCFLYRKHFKKSLFSKIKYKFSKAANSNLEELLQGVDFILNNTVANGKILEALRYYSDVPIVSYIHELSMVSKHLINADSVNKTYQLSEIILVPCETVRKFVLNEFGIDQSSVKKLNYYIPKNIVGSTNANHSFKLKDRFVVGGLGAVDWRKGSDIFLEVALMSFKLRPSENIEFIWLGARPDHLETFKLEHDLKNISEKLSIRFLPNRKDSFSFFEEIDLLLLPSREDPYPLVVLEAALFGIPTICFDKGGGAAEFVSNDAGSTVTYLDLISISDSIFNYIDNSDILHAKGIRAREKCMALHQNKELILAQFDEVIKLL